MYISVCIADNIIVEHAGYLNGCADCDTRPFPVVNDKSPLVKNYKS